MKKRRLVVLLALVGCTRSASKDDVRRDAGADAGPKRADAASPGPPSSGSTLDPAPASRVTAFYPVAQGACAAARPVLIGKTPVLHFPKAAWTMPAEGAPRALALQTPPHYSAFTGTIVGQAERIAVLGGIDEEHVWYTIGASSGRGEDETRVFLSGKALDVPRGAYGRYGIQNVIQQPDGEIWVFGHHGIYLDIEGDEELRGREGLQAWRYDKWFAFTKDGTRIEDRNVPGGDMANGARMESGEIIAAAISEEDHVAKLLRWSPTRKVNDLRANRVEPPETPDLLVGTTRAVMKTKGKSTFHSYLGDDKLTPSKLTGRPTSSWLVTKTDELWITTDDGHLFIETKSGDVREETLPEKGKLAAEKSTPWLLARSGAVYERTGAEWRRLELPDGLWSDAEHPPNRPEWVAVLGSETWVSAVRTDKGFGSSKPVEVRTFYASRPRATPLRCGSPFDAAMMGSLPARPDASCKDLVVLLGRERGQDGKVAVPYAKIAAALKGADLGETLTLDVFGSESVYGLHATSREAADVLVKKLGKVTAHEPEIVCGAPSSQHTATLDVRAGKFTSIPDASAP